METNKIYNENCLETMSRMNARSVDLVITSPPYNLNLRIHNDKYVSSSASERRVNNKYEDFEDNLNMEEYNLLHTKILKELLRVSDLVFYVVSIVTGSKPSVFQMIGEFNENLKEIIVWDKMHGQPAMRDGVLNRRTELILVFDSDQPIARRFAKRGYFERGTLDDIWQIRSKKDKATIGHGATFPKALVGKILNNFSKEGDIVYDPFIGTGTTALVAKMLKRQYLGSEINNRYFKLTKERLEQQDRQGQLF